MSKFSGIDLHSNNAVVVVSEASTLNFTANCMQKSARRLWRERDPHQPAPG